MEQAINAELLGIVKSLAESNTYPRTQEIRQTALKFLKHM